MCDMAKKRVAFHSELGVRYLCSLRHTSLEREPDDCRENTPLLRERFTLLFNSQSACAGFFTEAMRGLLRKGLAELKNSNHQ